MSLSNRELKEIAIVMGSSSDLLVLNEAINLLHEFDIRPYVEILSAHRTPQKMFDFAQNAKDSGFKIIIAGAGGAAHLPGMIASATTLPVIGIPIKSKHSLAGLDSLLSIVQMPAGVPVATMAVDGAKNAALFALQILSLSNKELAKKLEQYKSDLKDAVHEMNQNLNQNLL